MPGVGPGVREIRLRDNADIRRSIYLTNLDDAVCAPHRFSKKTRSTPTRGIQVCGITIEGGASTVAAGNTTMERHTRESVWDAIGRIGKFAIDQFVNMASRFGLSTWIAAERGARSRSVADSASARAGPEDEAKCRSAASTTVAAGVRRGGAAHDEAKCRSAASTTPFALIAAVDWSAQSHPSPIRETADSIWIAWKRTGREPRPKYFRTRSAAVAYLERLLDETEGPSLLAFDFPFGYPFGSGMAAKRDLYAEIAQRINDEDDNSNNRFEVAAELNAELNADRPGPFWGCPPNRESPTLTAKAVNRRGRAFPERRLAEERLAGRGIQTCWKLYTRGAVGSQMLLGLPVLHRLGQRPAVRLWPFETGWDRDLGGTVLAEMWPTLFDVAYDVHPIKDACQVLASVRWMDSHVPGALARPASIGPDEEDRVMAGEGWILGLNAG